MHALSEIDVDAGTAICSECGPTTVKRKSRAVGGNDFYRCVTVVREQRRRYNKTYQDKHGNRWRHDRRTKAEKQTAIDAQGGMCAICGSAEVPLVGDHDHLSGKPRGMLCQLCNLLLGMAKESEEVLLAAVEYLRAHRSL